MTPITPLSRKLGRAITRVTLCATAAAVAGPLAASAQAPAELSFCYGPLTGLVYRIKAPSAPAKCYHSTHVEFTVTDGVGVIRSSDVAAGDLSGTYPNPSVAALAGKPLDVATAPSADAVLTFKDGKWTPAALPAGGVSEERLSAAIEAIRVPLEASIQAATQAALAQATTLQSNIDALTASTDSRFATTETRVSGVQSTVAALGGQVGLVGGRPVSAAQPDNGNVLAWSGSAWAPAAPAAGGATMPCNNGCVNNASLGPGAVTGDKVHDGNLVRTVNGLSDQVTLAAGTNVAISSTGQTLTISSPVARGTLSGYVLRRNWTFVQPLSEFTMSVECPTGKRAISGGTKGFSGIAVLSSGPIVHEGSGDFLRPEFASGWEAKVRNNNVTEESTVDLFAICADVSP